MFHQNRFECHFLPCEFSSASFIRHINHIWDKHSLSNDFFYKCNILSCPKTYTSLQSYRRHVKATHSDFYKKHFIDNLKRGLSIEAEGSVEDSIDTDQTTMMEVDNLNNAELSDDHFGQRFDTSDSAAEEESINEIGNNCNGNNNEYENTNYENVIAHLLLNLREKFKVTTEATCYLSSKLQEIFKHQRLKLYEYVREGLEEEPNCKIYFTCPGSIEMACQKFSNQKALSNFVKSKREFVEPHEITLGFDFQTGKADTMQYISISNTLEVLLSHENILRLVDNGIDDSEVNKGRYNSFSDGSSYKENPFWHANNPSLLLQIILYHDDFNVVNPLGNKTTKHKMSAFYFVIGNIPIKYRSRLQDIHLALLCPASHIQKYGYNKILEPLLLEICALESKGISLEIGDTVLTFKGTLSMVIADNLAAHAIGGFFCNFSTVNRFCRFCYCTKEELVQKLPIHRFQLRTKESYSNNIDDILQFPELMSSYGMKCDSPLNSLNFFHVSHGLPPDIAHDIFEGFAVDALTLLVKSFIQQGFFSLKELNCFFVNFGYCCVDSENRPQPFKEKSGINFKIKQTACEMWNLIRLLPLFIGELIPTNSREWLNYLSFCQIVERLTAISFSSDDLVYLQSLIDSYFSEFFSLYNEAAIKPKSHFIQHYPAMIKIYGPLVKTLRFEAKHGYFKNMFAGSKNRKNVSQTLAKRHQMFMYIHYSDNNYLEHTNHSYTYLCEKKVFSFENHVIEALRSELNFTETMSILCCKSVKVDGQIYSTGSVVVLEFVDDSYQFGLIDKIFVNDFKEFFFCNYLQVIRFDMHFNSYEVIHSSHYCLCRVETLLDYHPLGIYNISSKLLVPLRHYITVAV